MSPLKGLPLKYLNCVGTAIADLSPLETLKLTALHCAYTKVCDLSPLKGMLLTEFSCSHTPVSDLSPLHGLNLTAIAFTPKNITKGIDAIRQMKSLKTIGISGKDNDKLPTDEFWKKYDAGEFGK